MQILFCKIKSLDVKCNNLSLGDQNCMILVGEETLEP